MSNTNIIYDVIISSSQRQSTVQSGGSASSSLFTVIFDNSLLGLYQMKQVQMPNSAYNVFASNGNDKNGKPTGNNIIYFTDTDLRIGTVAPGYYTDTTLLTAVQNAMNGAGGRTDYVCAVNGNSRIITISAGGNFSMTFGTNTANSIAGVLGFTNVDTTIGTSSVGTYVLNLRTIQLIGVILSSPSGTYKNVYGANSRQFSFILPVLVNTQDIIFYSEDFYRQQIYIDTPINTLTVSVVDINGNPLNIQNVDWNFILSPVKSGMTNNTSVVPSSSTTGNIVPAISSVDMVPIKHNNMDTTWQSNMGSTGYLTLN